MNEADTCRVLITPALQQTGWGDPVWRMTEQHYFTDGQIVLVGNGHKRQKGKKADYILRYEESFPIGVVEAKAEVAPIVRHPVEIQPDEWYPELGIRSFGNGLFEKPRVQGCEWTWQRPYWMSAGDLLFSNIKVWEGAVAVIPKAFDGYVGSHRYITCRADLQKATPEFLCQWFLSYEGLAQLGGCSPGATDRNRTLGLKKLEAIEVPLPPIEQQQEFGKLIKATQRARAAHEQIATTLEALLPALLDQAFQGDL